MLGHVILQIFKVSLCDLKTINVTFVTEANNQLFWPLLVIQTNCKHTSVFLDLFVIIVKTFFQQNLICFSLFPLCKKSFWSIPRLISDKKEMPFFVTGFRVSRKSVWHKYSFLYYYFPLPMSEHNLLISQWR